MVMVNLSLGWRQRLAVLQYQRGLLFIQHMAYAPAIAAFSRALRWHPHQAQVYIMRGMAHACDNALAAACADYDRAIALLPGDRRAHSKRALLRYRQGDEAGALADWAIALAGQPLGGNAESYFTRALLHLQHQDHGAALADLDQAIALDGNHARAYLQRGNLRQRLGDRPGAIQDWELAISNDFSLDEAKLKLQALEGQQQAESLASHIAQQLQTQLDPGGSTPVVEIASLLRVQLQFQASQLTVQVHHPLGIAINYGRWAETIRQTLVQRPQKGIYRFRMELYGEGSRFLEWSQTGNIYQGEPCPPSHWSWVVLTTLLVFPLGLPAAVFAWRTEQLFEAGDYLEAQRTSKTALGLCRLGVGLAGVVAIAAAGYGLFALVQPEHFRRLESGPVESGPVESGPRLEQGGDRERPAVQN